MHLKLAGACISLWEVTMKKTISIFLCLVLCMAVCSCTDEDEKAFSRPDKHVVSEEDASDTEPLEIRSDIPIPKELEFVSGSAQLENPDKMQKIHEYNGGEIEWTVSTTNNVLDYELAYKIYINGVQQPYAINDSNEQKLMHNIIVKGQGKKTVTKLKFTPVTGKKGDELFIYIVQQDAPSYRPVKDGPCDLGFLTTGSNMLYKLKYNADGANKKADAVKYESYSPLPEGYKILNCSGENIMEMKARYDTTSIFELYNNETYYESNGEARMECMGYIDLRSGKKTYKLSCYGGTEKTYRVSAYVNHNLIPIYNGHDYVDIKLQDDKLTELNIELDPEKIGLTGQDIFYVSVVPLEPYYDSDKEDQFLQTSPLQIIS